MFLKREKNDELIPLLFGELEKDSLKKLFPDVSEALTKKDFEHAKEILIEKTNDNESRKQLIAWNLLKTLGIKPDKSIEKQVLGVVIEVGLDNGTDYLAVYADNRARYFNFNGSKVIWEVDDGEIEINTELQKLIKYSEVVVSQIGPWDQPRRKPPNNGFARINFLTPMGLHFGEAPLNVLAEDPFAKNVISQALTILKLLTEYKKKPN